MTFRHSPEQVLSGKKTQMRRPIRPGKRYAYRVGKTYAVQPGVGQNAVARIEMLGVRKQLLGEVTKAEAVAEGFSGLPAFKRWWTEQYGNFDPKEEAWVLDFRLLEEMAT